MSAVILDSGALLAVERRPYLLARWFEFAARDKRRLFTSAAAVARVWRGGTAQVGLARLLKGTSIVPLDVPAAREVGRLLCAAGTSDVVGAHVALLAHPDDHVVTANPQAMARLLTIAVINARILAV